MKIVIQRVKSASVSVNNEIVSSIGQGMLLFVCIEKNDGKEQLSKAVSKMIQLRMFSNPLNGKMDKNIQDIAGEILCVSQFTLSWEGSGGNRPGFENSMEPVGANQLFEQFCLQLSDLGVGVKKGIFGADMQVSLINDGPVTFCLKW